MRTETCLLALFALLALPAAAMADPLPSWRDSPARDRITAFVEGVLAGGKEGLVEPMAATHSGLTVAEVQDAVRDWLATARHPETGRAHPEMVTSPCSSCSPICTTRVSRPPSSPAAGSPSCAPSAKTSARSPPRR